LSTIINILAREVLDSRGNPTVEAEVHIDSGARGRAIVPSGASTGAFEAFELRDAHLERYDGRGVRGAVRLVNETIRPALIGVDPTDQRGVDERLLALDPSPQKSKLGGNAILSVSLAAAHAGAAVRGVPLFRHMAELFRQIDESAPPPRIPLPMINMISGGLHAGGNLDFQDFLILPVEADSLATALEWSVRIYRRLGTLLGEAGYEGRLVGDEGGFGPRLANNAQAAEFVVRAIEAAGLVPGRDVALALDVASTHFYDGSRYRLSATLHEQLTSEQLIDQLSALVDAFPITSIEDGMAENDWQGWQELTRRLGARVRLVGDDLFTTNATRLQRGIELGAANSVLVKMNQIGTLSETFETIKLARRHGYAYVVSARSGETEDTSIADLAVATAAEHIKIGSIVRGERLAKYNQLLRIAEELEPAGWAPQSRA
jgi:enolase